MEGTGVAGSSVVSVRQRGGSRDGCRVEDRSLEGAQIRIGQEAPPSPENGLWEAVALR